MGDKLLKNNDLQQGGSFTAPTTIKWDEFCDMLKSNGYKVREYYDAKTNKTYIEKDGKWQEK